MGHFDAGLFFWSLATFAGLMLLLSRFAFKPLREMMEKREDTIHKAIEAANQARDDAQHILETQQDELRAAQEQARKTIDEGHRMVLDLRKEADVKNREQTETLLEHARTEIERETRKSLDELKGTVASLSIRITRQLIRENLDEKRHNELADQFIERLKKTRDASQQRQV